jgi:hypothetical protein
MTQATRPTLSDDEVVVTPPLKPIPAPPPMPMTLTPMPALGPPPPWLSAENVGQSGS